MHPEKYVCLLGGRPSNKWLLVSLNTNVQRGAEISVILMSLETSNLTLSNHANNQGASF